MEPFDVADGSPARAGGSGSPEARPPAGGEPSAAPVGPAPRRPPAAPDSSDPAQRLQRWETWVDRAIRQAQERGDFDNLPGHGKPLVLDDDPYAGEWRTAFRALKNAGMAPPWIEANREIVAVRAELKALREGTARRLAALPSPAPADAPVDPSDRPRPAPGAPRPTPRWRRLLFGPGANRMVDRGAPRSHAAARLTEGEAERLRARRRYLDRAAALDAKIAEHNGLLPDDLRRLEQPRLTSAQAARDFDAACPPTGDDGRALRRD